jgi:ABC-type transport system involved in multi-copper enzyme maturation permease subunit
MFGILFSKEIREHLMTFRFGAALVATFALVLLSVWILGDDYIRRRENYNRIAEKAAQAEREVFVPSFLFPVVHYPPSPLSIFAQGEDQHLGNSVVINRWEVPRKATDSLTDNVLLNAEPSFDLLAIFSLVISIFAILFSYDSINGERERGTLKLICLGKISRTQIFLAKFAAGVCVLALPFLFSFVASLLVLQFVHGIGFTPAQWPAIILMIVTGLIYGALFFALGMLCSSLTGRSSTSLILSLLLWATGVLLIPDAAVNVASMLEELPDPTEITNFEQVSYRETREKISAHVRSARTDGDIMVMGGSGLVIPKPYLFDGNPAMYRWFADALRFGEPLLQRRAESVWQVSKKYEDAMIKQAELASLLSTPAPAHHLRAAFTALAGTDYSVNRDFIDSARRFRSAFLKRMWDEGLFGANVISFFSRRPLAEALSEEGWVRRYAEYKARRKAGEKERSFLDPRQWGELPPGLVPEFAFEGGAPDFEAASWPIAVLLTASILVFCLGMFAFSLYDVR